MRDNLSYIYLRDRELMSESYVQQCICDSTNVRYIVGERVARSIDTRERVLEEPIGEVRRSFCRVESESSRERVYMARYLSTLTQARRKIIANT